MAPGNPAPGGVRSAGTLDVVDPFVGRARELDRLADAADALRHGRGLVVVVTGEAGAGKTRLCTEVADRARGTGVRVVVAPCWSDGGAPPLWPWQSILAELCGAHAVDLLRTIGGPPDAPYRPGLFARLAAVTDRLSEVCASDPLCLVMDDVQAADAEALLVLRFVAQSLSRLPILLVLGRRRREPAAGSAEARLLDELERDGTVVALGGFDPAETDAFLCAQGVGPVAPDTAAAVCRLTRGNPSVLGRVAEAMRAPAAEPAEEAGLRVAVDHALAGLGSTARRVLSVAAVLGSTPLVSEVAEVAGCDTVTVLDAVAGGADAGLVVGNGDGEDADRIGLRHEPVRAALEDLLPPADLLEVHARAADVLAGSDLAGPRSERLVRAAHHARNAATRSTDDARRAVSLCEAAAQALMRREAYEQADALLSAAVDLHDSARLGRPRALLVLQWAKAASLRGHVHAARERHEVAVARAEADGRPGLRAEAALGRAGVWVGGYATPGERSRALALYQRALDGLPDDPDCDSLRVRLGVRLVAEAAFPGGPTEPLAGAVETARGTGDPSVLAEALALAHHALFSPQHSGRLLPLADELVQVAETADVGPLSLMGLLWRTVDILHLGGEPCTRALEALRERAVALGNEEMLYHVAVVDGLLRMGGGRLSEAEAGAVRAHQLGERIGRADRDVYLAGQIGSIRWMQGRGAEVLTAVEAMTTSTTLSDDDFSVWAMAACLAGRADDHGRARMILQRCLPSDLGALQPSGTWLAGLVAVVEAVDALDDRDLAGQAYELLLPYAHLPAVAGLGIVCLGSTERSLGIAAGTLGRHDLAVEHLTRAVAANERLGNRPLATISRGDLAGALLGRDDPATDERRHAAALLRQAIAEGRAMDLSGRVAEWQVRLDGLRAMPRPAGGPVDPGVADVPGAGPTDHDAGGTRRVAASGPHGVIRRDGRRWIVEAGGRRIRVPDRVGMRHLAVLLANPGQRIPAVLLADRRTDPRRPERHEVLDRQARHAYAARAREVAADLADAESDADLHRAERLRVELDALVDELEAATGLGGRPRHFPDDHERARVAVQKAIKRAIDAVDDADPWFADLFRQTIATGAACSYTPHADAPAIWSSSGGAGPQGMSAIVP